MHCYSANIHPTHLWKGSHWSRPRWSKELNTKWGLKASSCNSHAKGAQLLFLSSKAQILVQQVTKQLRKQNTNEASGWGHLLLDHNIPKLGNVVCPWLMFSSPAITKWQIRDHYSFYPQGGKIVPSVVSLFSLFFCTKLSQICHPSVVLFCGALWIFLPPGLTATKLLSRLTSLCPRIQWPSWDQSPRQAFFPNSTCQSS